MKRAIEFFSTWIVDAKVQWLRGDPLLMGAAIAYNSLFALVPLAIAFVSILTLLEASGSTTSRFIDFIDRALPPEVADFLVDILQDSSTAVEADQTLVLMISILVALWSGSRAVYAVQKSLRLVQAEPDQRGYIRARFTGLAVTVGAGASVMVGYSLLLFGEELWGEIAERLGLGSSGLAQIAVSIILAVWVFSLLWVVYRFGPPRPVKYTAVVAAVVVFALVVGSWVAFTLLPAETRSAAAAFGALGVMLIFLYFVGVVVVAGPIVVTTGWGAWSQASGRYASKDERDAIEAEGPQERDDPPRTAPQ